MFHRHARDQYFCSSPAHLHGSRLSLFQKILDCVCGHTASPYRHSSPDSGRDHYFRSSPTDLSRAMPRTLEYVFELACGVVGWRRRESCGPTGQYRPPGDMYTHAM